MATQFKLNTCKALTYFFNNYFQNLNLNQVELQDHPV